FILFIVGLIALFILLVNLGPLIWLAICAGFLYLVFRKFMQSDSTSAKIGWGILGLVIISMIIPTSYSVIGIGAAIVLYFIYKSWNKKDNHHDKLPPVDNDPFSNFEREWNELKNY